MSSVPSRHTNRQPAFAWLLVATLVGALSLFVWSGLAAGATQVSASHAQTLRPGIVSDPGPPAAAEDDRSEEPLASTVFLPLVSHGWWEPPSSFGVQLYRRDPAVADSAAQVSAAWVRLPFNWASIEPQNTTPENYQWPATLDRQLAYLAAHNVHVILTLQGNPDWAATYPAGPIDRVDLSELVQFMQAAVTRYNFRPYYVKHWEFYNEPDNGDPFFAQVGWGYFGYQPEAYAELLKAVYEPMKRMDSRAQIVFGGVAYDGWEGPFVEDFVDKVFFHGGADHFDVMNFHYYPAFRHNWEPYGTDIIGKANYLRSQMAAHGVDKPLICTETGMWSNQENGDQIQSRYVPQVFARSIAADLQPTIWYQLIDDKTLGSYKFGLLSWDLDPKPAYYAFQTLAQQLSAADYVRTLGTDETGSDQVEAYEFLAPNGSTQIIVTWTNDELVRTLVLGTDQVIIVETGGSETTIYDGDDGTLDGLTEVSVGPSPSYLRFQALRPPVPTPPPPWP